MDLVSSSTAEFMVSTEVSALWYFLQSDATAENKCGLPPTGRIGKLTNPYPLLPVGIIHVVIQNLLPVSFTHCPSYSYNLVNRPPEGFQDFSINLSNPIYKVERVFWETLWNMCSKMPFPHSRNYRNPLRDFQVGTLFYPFLEMDVPLASNIIDGNYPLLR